MTKTFLVYGLAVFFSPALWAADWILERRDIPGNGVVGQSDRPTGVRVFADGKVTEFNDNSEQETGLATLAAPLLATLQKYVDAVPASNLVAKKTKPCPDKGIIEYRFRKTAGEPTVFYKDDFCRISELANPAPEKLKFALDKLSDLRTLLVPEF